MMQTIQYKGGYIHLSYTDGRETVRVSVTPFSYCMTVKSLRAAKILITRNQKNYGGRK